MKTTRYHENMSDRYKYDFNVCSYKRGFAQVDTEQDASYYGTWANPSQLRVVSYIEGDVVVHECETEQEFINELRAIDTWNQQQGYKPVKIDCFCSPEIKALFDKMNLSDMLH